MALCWSCGMVLDIETVSAFYSVLQSGTYTAAAIDPLVTTNVTWIVPGDPRLVPYAGTWSGTLID